MLLDTIISRREVTPYTYFTVLTIFNCYGQGGGEGLSQDVRVLIYRALQCGGEDQSEPRPFNRPMTCLGFVHVSLGEAHRRT
jgi:hypothetical protein